MLSTPRYFSAILVTTLLATSGHALAQTTPKPPLPLKTVRLYESGVGYFERSGRVGRDAGLALPVPVSHLDDALKTLVVLGTDGKTSVAGIEFASSISVENGRALAGLSEGSGPVTHASLLRSLKGGGIELRTARETVKGKLVDVLDPDDGEPGPCVPVAEAEAPKKPGEGAPGHCVSRKETTLLVLTTEAEIRKFFLSDVVGVKPTDSSLAARLGASASVSSTQGTLARRDLRVLAESTSDVTLGYVAEAPVWRSTYRMVLSDKEQRGILQGWALVHNDTDEEWKKVKVELVNGRPDSFLYPLAAPRYTRRELVAPAEALSTVPQLVLQTADAMWSEMIGDTFGAGGLGLSGLGEGGGGRGEGIGLGRIGTIGHGSGTGTGIDQGSSTVLSVGDLAKVAEAEGMEAGALFRYSMPLPIDLRAHGSALLPFLQQSVSARRIVWFGSVHEVGRSAARIKNDTKQTLPAGPISFFADGGFAGEAQIDRLKPSEIRFLAFGTDIDVELTQNNMLVTDEVQLVELQDDQLVEHFIRHTRVDYTIENRSGGARTVFLNLDVVRNATVTGADELDFDVVSNKPFAVFASEPRSKKVRRVEADEGLSRGTAMSTLNPRGLRAIAAAPKLPAAQRATLEDAAKHLTDAEARESLLPKRRADLDELVQDLGRLRGYLAATRSKNDAEKFTAQILEKEAKVKELRTRIASLGTEVEGYRGRARTALAKLHR
ncbi:hypothetical protein [Polyangium mundeleinium]|uniref:DUF4139 domain-containing protein n=1 Tax=Polyangium mundeleinium TaxID=2995306 RepID=A0ABT5EMU6_9BACT|nr:hypothetical protein [Polyangium mundeleinium]MDC0743158.1 hypothetical protein [Polyangium mundeleinium]